MDEDGGITTVDALLAECAKRTPLTDRQNRRTGLQLSFKRGRDGERACFCDIKSAGRKVRFYRQAAVAENHRKQSNATNSIVVDMERVGLMKGNFVSFGRVYAVMNQHELKHFMQSLHFSDLHLYESLGATPHKLLIDMDRDLQPQVSWEQLSMWDQILDKDFLPMFCSFLNSSTVDGFREITIDDILVTDASCAGKKYSKHILVHTSPALCCRSREEEKAFMGAFRAHVDTVCKKGDLLHSFLFVPTESGTYKSVIDYGIYTKGKRSMRLVGSCKGSGKSTSGTHRNLVPDRRIPERHHHASLPWWAYTCNTWGMQSAFWSFNKTAKKAMGNGRKRKTIRSTSTQSTAQYADVEVPCCVRNTLLKLAAKIHPRSRSVSVSMQPAHDDGCRAVCMINYAAEPGEERMCAFAQAQHNRHYAAVIMHLDETVEYFCYGCMQTVTLSDDTAAGSAMHTNTATANVKSSFLAEAERLIQGCKTHQIDQRYLPVLHANTTGATDLIKSAMGTGKTYAIAGLLTALPDEAAILSVGFRQTLNTSLATRFRLSDYGELSYNDIADCHRLSVQIDSLLKLLKPTSDGQLQMRRVWDVVIIDEAESLLAYMLSDTMKNKVQHAWKLLTHILRHAKHVILCDADLATTALEATRNLRRSVPCAVWHNTHTPRHLTYVITHNSDVFTSKALRHIRQQKRIFVASNSRRYALFLRDALLKLTPQVLLIQGASSAKNKKSVADCNEIWSQYKAVICTPAIAAGVDFSRKDYFDTTFVYGTNKSNTARELNQQSGRVRETKGDRVYVCLEQQTPKKQPICEYDKVCEWFDNEGICRRRDLMQMTIDNTSISNDQIAVNVSSCPQDLKTVLCRAITERNRSKADIQAEYEQLVTTQGGKVFKLPCQIPSYSSIFSKHMCIVQAELTDADKVAAAPLVAEALSAKDTTFDEAVLQKAELSKHYGDVNITSGTIVSLLRKQQFIDSVTNWCNATAPIDLLFQRDMSSGCMQQFSFVCHESRTHVAQHSAVVELCSPAWQQHQDLLRCLFVAGCQSVSIEPPLTCSLPPECPPLAAIAEGLFTSSAAARLETHAEIFVWAELFLKELIPANSWAKPLRICKGVMQFLSQKYFLDWSNSGQTVEQRAGEGDKLIRHRHYTPNRASLVLIAAASSLRSQTLQQTDVAHAQTTEQLHTVLQNWTSDTPGDALHAETCIKYVKETMQRNAEKSAVREYASARARLKEEPRTAENDLQTWDSFDTLRCAKILERTYRSLACLL